MFNIILLLWMKEIIFNNEYFYFYLLIENRLFNIH